MPASTAVLGGRLARNPGNQLSSQSHRRGLPARELHICKQSYDAWSLLPYITCIKVGGYYPSIKELIAQHSTMGRADGRDAPLLYMHTIFRVKTIE